MNAISGLGCSIPTATTKLFCPGLTELIEHIEENNAERIAFYRRSIASNTIVFDGLQELYAAGTVVKGATSLGVPSGFRVSQCYYQERKTLFGLELSFHLQLQFVFALGADFGVAEFEHVMSKWIGEANRSVSELQYSPASTSFITLMKNNGRRYLDLGAMGKPRYLHHESGSVILQATSSQKSKGAAATATAVMNSSGRILIDVVGGAAHGIHPSRGVDDASTALIDLTGQYRRFRNERKAHGTLDESPPDSIFLLSSIPEELLAVAWPALQGYSFTAKSWGLAMVHGLSEIKFNDAAFDELVLDPARKRLIRALVRFGGDQFEDIIEGKSGGSIFLLHGPPGIGKTLTAEAIAEVLHKPLYYVTMGELGIDPVSMEAKLGEILELCGSWDALVLIDEADVFLEKRSTSDVLRNAMVCVMLRLLEYHKGILFLTTNRVTEFDTAFESRVTVALKYDHLTESARSQIWKTLVTKVKSCEKDPNIAYDDLAKHQLNGRQIKNAIRLAVALAMDEKKPLSTATLLQTIAICATARLEIASADKY